LSGRSVAMMGGGDGGSGGTVAVVEEETWMGGKVEGSVEKKENRGKMQGQGGRSGSQARSLVSRCFLI
jgi:hypothetical protein